MYIYIYIDIYTYTYICLYAFAISFIAFTALAVVQVARIIQKRNSLFLPFAFSTGIA